MDSITQKRVCTKCGECKPIDEFYRNKYSKGGHKNSCKICDKKHSFERRAKVQTGELSNRKICRTCKIEKTIADFYSSVSTKDGYSTQCKRCTFWEHKIRGNVPDRKKVPIEERRRKSNIRVRRFKENHPEIIKRWGREYYTKNKLGYLVNNHNRRARIYENGGSFTGTEWIELCDRYDNKCLCCGEIKPLTIDHVIPVSRGGTSDIDNIQPLCLDCNKRKHTQTTDYRL